MPIGNPMGDDTQFDERGNLESIRLVTIPVKDLERSVEFYTEALGLRLTVLDKEHGWAELATPGGRIALAQRKEGFGVDTGIVFGTNSIFDLHRKLVDREVEFTIKPTRVEWLGLLIEFKDLDNNRMRALEEEARPDAPRPVLSQAKEESSNVRRIIITKPSGPVDKV